MHVRVLRVDILHGFVVDCRRLDCKLDVRSTRRRHKHCACKRRCAVGQQNCCLAFDVGASADRQYSDRVVAVGVVDFAFVVDDSKRDRFVNLDAASDVVDARNVSERPVV